MIARPFLIAILIFSLLGIIDAGYAVYQHYTLESDAACNISETINCDVVNQSVYSEMSGIPVAGIGLAGYVFFAAVSVLMLMGRYLKGIAVALMLIAALFAFVYSASLTYIEVFILKAVCPMCAISMTLVTVITVLAFAGALSGKGNVASTK